MTRRLFSAGLFVGLVLMGLFLSGGISLVRSASAATTVVVSPAAMQGWEFRRETGYTGVGQMTITADPPPMGVGSARLAVSDTSDRVYLVKAGWNNVRLADITRLEYRTYRLTGSAPLAVSLQLQVDDDITDMDTRWKGRLVFEPYYTWPVQDRQWQTWNALTDDGTPTVNDPGTGNWWGTGSPFKDQCPISNPCTWAEVLNFFPNAGIHLVYGAVLFKAGGGWNEFDGLVDAFTIGVSGQETTYNFEPFQTGKLWVDDDGLVDVAGESCEGLNVAYTSVQAAINAASDGAEIVVCPGVYYEKLTLAKDNLTVRSFDRSAVDGSPDTELLPLELDTAGVLITGNGNTFEGFKVRDPTDRLFHNHAHRLVFVQGDNNVVRNNMLVGRSDSEDDVGVLVQGGGVGNGVAEGNQVVGNQVGQVKNRAIAVVSLAADDAAAGTLVQQNTVINNAGRGIVVDRSPNTTVERNELDGNGVALYLNSTASLSASGTVFRCNSVLTGNATLAENAATDGTVMLAEENWWGSPSGPDAAKVVGDVDYTPWLTAPPGPVCPPPTPTPTATATATPIPPTLTPTPSSTPTPPTPTPTAVLTPTPTKEPTQRILYLPIVTRGGNE